MQPPLSGPGKQALLPWLLNNPSQIAAAVQLLNDLVSLEAQYVTSANTSAPDPIQRRSDGLRLLIVGRYRDGVPAYATDEIGSSVSTAAATNISPYGYTSAQANAIPTLINQLRTDVRALASRVNALLESERDMQAAMPR